MSERSDFLEQKKQELGVDDPRIELDRVCSELNIETSWSYFKPRDKLFFRVEFPNGRSRRRQIISPQLASDLLAISLNFTYLGDYDAILMRDEGMIEATVIGGTATDRHLKTLPGVRRLESAVSTESDSADLDVDSEVEEVEDPNAMLTRGDSRWRNSGWVLEYARAPSSPGIQIELGSASREFTFLSERFRGRFLHRQRDAPQDTLGRFTSLRIHGVQIVRHDDALDLLNRVSGAVFFELDLQYGAAMQIAPSLAVVRSRLPTTLRDHDEPSGKPKIPRNQYPEKPLSLYWYGRYSRGLPLLEYLAYYQVLEFFFPSFSHRDSLERLRSELMDPRFRADDDSHLVKILGLLSGSGKGFGSERDQLRSTVAGCVTEGHIRELIEKNDDLRSHFRDHKLG